VIDWIWRTSPPQCEPEPIFGPISVDLFAFIEDGVTYGGQVVINNILTDYWNGSLASVWVNAAQPSIPVQYASVGFGGDSDTYLFEHLQVVVPPPAIFTPPSYCASSKTHSNNGKEGKQRKFEPHRKSLNE